MKAKSRLYKIVIRKNSLSSRSLKTVTDVSIQELSQTIYGLLSEFPGCSATINHQPDIFILKPKGITKNLTKLLGNKSYETKF